MKKKLLIICQYYYPENFRVNDISIDLLKFHYDITVLTGIPNYPKGKFYKGYNYFNKRKEVINGVKVIRLPILPRFNSKLFLFINYISFIITGYIWAIFNKIKFEIVYCYQLSPITMALPGIFIAIKQKIPFILYVTDLWPESLLFAARIKNIFFIKILNKIVNYIYEKSSKILISSKGYKVPISKRIKNLDKIIYWPQYAEEIYKPFIATNSEDQSYLSNKLFTITYTGNIGFAQDFDVLVNAVKLLKEEGLKLKINIVGNGRFLKQLKHLVFTSNISEYFYFLGSKAPFEIPQILYTSDVAYLSLADEILFSYTLPSKFQTYLACGIPILASINGEASRLIKEANCGYSSRAGNSNDLADNIKKMRLLRKSELVKLGLNGLHYSNTHFNKKTLLNKLDYIFQNSKIGII